MFEQVQTFWAAYTAKESREWASDDPRHHLAAEVDERLQQLDLCLALVSEQESLLTERSRGFDAEREYCQKYQPRLRAGDISIEQYIAGHPKTQLDHRPLTEAFARMRLHAEMFYLVAWRIRQILNSKAPRDFQRLPRINAKSVCEVRNQLIEHPDHLREHGNYAQHFVFTDDGPVLKSKGMVVRGDGSHADIDSLDRGLYVNAASFETEIRSALTSGA